MCSIFCVQRGEYMRKINLVTLVPLLGEGDQISGVQYTENLRVSKNYFAKF